MIRTLAFSSDVNACARTAASNAAAAADARALYVGRANDTHSELRALRVCAHQDGYAHRVQNAALEH